jgi:hypothetical protein
MKKNPFYGMSAAAMLFGCYMVNHALDLEPGRVGKLLTLMAVLQVYEGLLIALGVYLVKTRRAPQDGVTVLALEALFLVDATLLAMECVTASPGVGAAVVVVLLGLAFGKLALVRHFLPDALPRSVAVFLGLLAALVYGLPVAATNLASARVLAPVSMNALWWLTLALPLAQHKMREASAAAHPGASRAHVAWIWVPTVSVVVHLVALGWIHQVPFHLAYLTPLLLGQAVVVEREQVVQQVLLPALAALVSIGQAETLGIPLSLVSGYWVSPLRIATLGAAAAYGVLAWRHRHRWLVALAAASGLAGVLGTSLWSIGEFLTGLLRLVRRLLPHDALSWGLNGVVGAFVLLGMGAWRSLRGGRRFPGPSFRSGGRKNTPRHGDLALALFLVALAAGSIIWALETYPLGHARQRGPAWTGTVLAAAAVALAIRAHGRAAQRPEESPERPVAVIALFAGLVGLFSLPLVALGSQHSSGYESAVIGDIRTVISSQAAYQTRNGGYFDGSLACLARPAVCIPGYGGDPARFLDAPTASLAEKHGYRRAFHPGAPPDRIPPSSSPTSVTTWAYTAVPVDPGYTGVHGWCGDSRGYLCFRRDGTSPPLRPDRTCDLEACVPLQ